MVSNDYPAVLSTLLALALVGCERSSAPNQTASSESASTTQAPTPQANSPNESEGQVTFNEEMVDLSTSIDSGQWTPCISTKPFVQVIAGHARCFKRADSLHFRSRESATIFAYRPHLTGSFRIELTVTFDESPTDLNSIKWAAGFTDAASEQVEVMISSPADLFDGSAHTFEIAHANDLTTLTFDGHLCQSMTHPVQHPIQFFLYTEGNIDFRMNDFRASIDSASFASLNEPATPQSSRVRPRLFQPRPIVDGESTIIAGGQIERVTVGDSGKHMFLHNPSRKRIQVVDTVNRSLIRDIPIGSERVMMAAGSHHLVLCFPNERRLVSYAIDTLAPVGERMLDTNIHQIALGAGSSGPLLCICGLSGQERSFRFLTPNSLDDLDTSVVQSENASAASSAVRSYTSTNGKTFGLVTEHSYYSMIITGEQAEVFSRTLGKNQFMFQCILPSASGKWLYADGKKFNPHLETYVDTESSQSNGWELFPSIDGEYYLTVGQLDPPKQSIEGLYDSLITIYSVKAHTPAVQLVDVDLCHEVSIDPNSSRSLFPNERIHYIPSINTLVTIPRTNEHVVFREVLNAHATKHLAKEASGIASESHAQPIPPQPRTWTDAASGKTIDASFIRRKGNVIRLRRSSDGREFEIDLDRLSQTDQEYASQQPES